MARNIQLASWKEIAAHLRTSVRTAQRWERELGLPVQRLGQRKKSMVFANLNELDKWMFRSIGSTDAKSPSDGSELRTKTAAHLELVCRSIEKLEQRLAELRWLRQELREQAQRAHLIAKRHLR